MDLRILAAVAALTFSTISTAQVHRCTDAAGKTSFSDAPCPTSAKSAARVLGSSATERRPDEEATAAERNMQSIENASRILREPTSDAVGDQGAGVIASDPNERIRAQDERNTAQKRAQAQAEQQRREERRARQEAAARVPAMPAIRQQREISNCAGAFCYDRQGGSYMRNGDQLLSNDGKSCRQRIGGNPGQLDCS